MMLPCHFLLCLQLSPPNLRFGILISSLNEVAHTLEPSQSMWFSIRGNIAQGVEVDRPFVALPLFLAHHQPFLGYHSTTPSLTVHTRLIANGSSNTPRSMLRTPPLIRWKWVSVNR